MARPGTNCCDVSYNRTQQIAIFRTQVSFSVAIKATMRMQQLNFSGPVFPLTGL